ncbi:hypothetical protein LSTR_LSTR013797 [Laodelphax striatellus]|uniref:C2HC/C3H-type domain-containing protein n=1 Tax=Laodelphax striatellus TaxID=195883 RepID=A0A482WVC7_LAOST|nr:hypothetical protein LSTR_LSTR013797 [Laodelphax striatellus]
MAEPEESIPSVLLPCNSCGRTFRPDALSKHEKYCEKSLIKKRKVFDSAKQRLQGDLAEFLPVLATQKKKIDKSPIRKTQSKWKEKHLEFVRAIRAAKGGPASTEGGGGAAALAPPVKPVDHEKCLYCDRYFGPKAYDRHLEWCKEHSSLVRPKSPASIQAKQRLEARTKYKAPLLNRTRRASISEKCSPKSCTRDPSPAADRLTRTRSSSLSSRTVTNMNREPLSNVSSKTNSGMDSFRRNQPARNSRRSVSPLKKTTPETAKNKAVNNNLNQNNRTRGRQVTSHVVKNEAKREEKTTPKSVKDDIFSASCNISPITPGQNQRQKTRTPSHNSGPKYSSHSQSKGEQCMLNTILISQDVMGMTVQQCCLKSDTETDELAEKYYKVGEESKYLKCAKARQTSSRKSPSVRYVKRQQFKPDLSMSNDIVHFTGIDDDQISKQIQIYMPSTDCDNFIPDVHESDSSIEILRRTKNSRILDANELADSIVTVGQCSNIGDDNADNKLGTYDLKLVPNEVGVSLIDRELLTSDLDINSSKFHRDDGNASQCSESRDEFDLGQNSFFTEECSNPEMVARPLEKEEVEVVSCSLEKEVVSSEVNAMLLTENEPKVSLKMLFSNPKLDSKENLCSNCRKSKSESDVLLFYRKDMMKCCIKQRERIFEVKKSLFSLLSNHALDAPSRHKESQGSLWEDAEPDFGKVGEYDHPSTDPSFTKYKSCSSINEKTCSDNGSEIEVIDESEIAEGDYNFQWGSTHEILSPKRKLSPESVDLVEVLEEKFCNPIFSDEGPRVEEVSSIQEDLVDYIGGCKIATHDFPSENYSEVQYPSIEVPSESVDLIESLEQVSICDTAQDCLGDRKAILENETSEDDFYKSSGEYLHRFVECQTVGSSELLTDGIENSHNGFHKSSEEFLSRLVECEAICPTTFEQPNTTGNSHDGFQKSMNTSGEFLPDCGECESGLSATFELPDKVSDKEDENLNAAITTDVCLEEKVGLIDDELEIDAYPVENVEDDRLSYIIESDKIIKENDNVEEFVVTSDSGNHVKDGGEFIRNGSEQNEFEQQDQSKERLKTRKKWRIIECNKLKNVSILNYEHNLDYNEGSLENVESVDPRADNEWAEKLQTTNKKSLLRRKFKSKIPSRNVNKPPADVRLLKNKIQTPSKNKTGEELETWKSRFPVIGKSSSPTETESIPNIELEQTKTESESCAVLYYNESVGRLWKINNFNADCKGFENSRNKTSYSKEFEFSNSRNKTFSLPPIKESSSAESSKSLSIKQSETKIERVQRNGAVESIETNLLRKKHLPMIRRTTSNEMNVEDGRKIARSLNRKSPQEGSPVDVDNCSSGSDCSSTRGKAAHTANFCHECGAKFPVLAAKFCCNCGVRRLII